MALYPNIITTASGWELVSKSNAQGKNIVYTRVVLGDGDIDMESGDILNLQAVISPKLELAITKKATRGNGGFSITGVLDNATLENGFHMREVGVMARLEGTSNEILFAYTNGGNYVDYLANKTRPMQQEFTVFFIVGNAKHLDITVPNDVYVTARDLSDHDQDPNAHGAVITKALEGLKTHKELSVLDHPDGCVTTEKLKDGAVTTAKIENRAVTNSKLDEVNGNVGTFVAVTVNRQGRVTMASNSVSESVTFSGTIKVPTKSENDNTTNAASTAFVKRAIDTFAETVTGKIQTAVDNATSIEMRDYK